MLDVRDSPVKQFMNVIVIQGVKHLATGAAYPDHTQRTEYAQLVGCSRFAHPDEPG